VAAVSDAPLSSVSQVLEWREQGKTFSNDTPLEHAHSAQLLARAFTALDQESPECLTYFSLAIERAPTPQDARVCCAVALVVLDLDSGTLSNVPAWIARFNATKDAPLTHPLAQFWSWLGDMVAHSYDENVFDMQRLRASANSIMELFGALDSGISADTQVVAGQMLLNYAIERDETALVDLVVSIVTHPKLMNNAKPLTQARFFEELGYKRFGLNNAVQAKIHWQTALEIAKQHQLKAAGFMARIGLTRQLLDEQDYAAAEKNIAEFVVSAGFGRGFAVAQYKHLRARYLLLKKNVNAASVEIEEALAIAKRVGLTSSALHLYLQEKAQVLFCQGKGEEAEQLLLSVDDFETGISGIAVKANASFMSYLRFSNINAIKAHAALIQGFELASSIGFVRFLRSIPDAAAKVCAAALEADVYVDFVHETIYQRGLAAPAGATQRWPWPLRIKTLGTLAVELHGKPLAFPGRTQAKPLELLCYLASSTDMRADNLSLCAALWSADDLSKSNKSLETTISRLRKLLGHDDFVLVAHGQVWLDSGAVWCDWAHMRMLSQQLSTAAATTQATTLNVEMAAKEVLVCYRGPFLAGSEETPWLLGRRADAVQRFVATALSAKAAWQRTSGPQALVSFLESALLHEPLSEGLVTSLMQHYASHQQPADALRIYRFFRNQLSLRTGLQPGAAVESLKKTLLL
jgi:DNA-binding SARP family transcriptional activator